MTPDAARRLRYRVAAALWAASAAGAVAATWLLAGPRWALAGAAAAAAAAAWDLSREP